MIKICFVSGTRADYGIMAPVMRIMAQNPEVQLQIVATNMHMSACYGMTVDEIEADGFRVDVKLESLVAGGTAAATVLSMAKVQEGLAGAFETLKPDLVVILGDRYEALASAAAAVVFEIPVAHLHGGETTLGAIDDKFRHAITQLSTYHFASTPQYADRIISMGADPAKVYHSGAPGAEGGENERCKMQDEEGRVAKEFQEKTGFWPGEPFIMLAFHPVTLLPDKGKKELQQTLEALDVFIIQGYRILATMPNSDPGTEMISGMIREWAEKHKEAVSLVKSLGAGLFHYALDNALAIVGNSSAALIEAPTYRLGAVNVGERQKGRAQGVTVVDVPGEKGKIVKALEQVMSFEMKAVLLGQPISALNPYYKENSALFIAERLIEVARR